MQMYLPHLHSHDFVSHRIQEGTKHCGNLELQTVGTSGFQFFRPGRGTHLVRIGVLIIDSLYISTAASRAVACAQSQYVASITSRCARLVAVGAASGHKHMHLA